jgi:hypothetical protein
MQHTLTRTGALGLLVLALWASQALAVTSTGFMGDDVIARGYNSMTQVWIPTIALGGIIGLVINCFAGFVRIGTKVVGFLFGIILLAGGLPMIASYSGGTLATSFILP